MKKDMPVETEIAEKELVDLFSDDEEIARIIDQDEKIIYDDTVWEQQNIRLKKEGVVLTDREKEMVVTFNHNLSISQIAKTTKINIRNFGMKFHKLCKKLCVKNQKEAYRRAKELNLL